MYQLVITSRAITDIEKAKKWYNEQEIGLGVKFSDHIFRSFDSIHKRPLGYPNKYGQTREMVVKKYPYLIIYTIEERFIFILRVFPCRTNPKSKYKKK